MSDSQAAANAAASFLLNHWRAGTRCDGIPEALRPVSRQAAYDIAGEIGLLKKSGVAGWKIAATSAAGQKHINVEGPLAGRIYEDRLVAPGAAVALADNTMRVAEAEFAFRFGRALPPRAMPYRQDDVLAAVSDLHLSLEVPDSRYADFTRAGADQLIADTACASWLALGPAVAADWQSLSLAGHRVTSFKNDAKHGDGIGSNVLGDPLHALTWMVNEAGRYCGGIGKGQFVTTGTCVVPVPIAPGDSVAMEFGSLGSISLRFV